jgi:hypothetical protein
VKTPESIMNKNQSLIALIPYKNGINLLSRTNENRISKYFRSEYNEEREVPEIKNYEEHLDLLNNDLNEHEQKMNTKPE